MSPPKGIFFDLDGTLLDTAEDLGSAMNHVLATRGLPTLSIKQYRNTASHGSKGLLELGFGKDIVNYDVDVLRREFLAFYGNNIANYTTEYEGVDNTLALLDEYRVPWGIVTNKPEALALQLLEYFPRMRDCAVIIGGDTFKQRKPDPFPLIQAAKVLEVAAADCVYVGDAQRDIQAANSAQMFSVIANYGYIEATDNVNMWQSKMSIDHFSELLHLFDWEKESP